MESKNKKLRSGFTTGACAAAAAKAAALLLLRLADETGHADAECGMRNEKLIEQVEIPFPDGSRVAFKIHDSGFRAMEKTAFASVIKDAGDDPDITNGAEIAAEARMIDDCRLVIDEPENKSERRNCQTPVIVRGGKGVGIVTKPGLAVPVGEPAINPVPMRMIRESVQEAIIDLNSKNVSNRQSPIIDHQLIITISVPAGEDLAKKTLNHRLGIVGGISILGTTGIVRPLSAAAWTATITASMDVAKAAGLGTVVISSGRTSEKAHMKKFHFPEEAYAMMGDYLEFSLLDAKRHGFREVHLCAQWAKMLKAAMGTPQTHVRHGALEAKEAADFLLDLGIDLPCDKVFNTSREIYDFINSEFRIPPAPSAYECSRECRANSAFEKVCTAAKRYAEGITSGLPVIANLVSYEGDILAQSE